MSPDPGAASGKIAGTQGDMEKADMVDGAFAQRDNYGALLVCHPCFIQSFRSPAPMTFLSLLFQA